MSVSKGDILFLLVTQLLACDGPIGGRKALNELVMIIRLSTARFLH